MSNMVVRTNVFALNAHRNLKNVGVDQSRASNRLASGYRINIAADDAAGLAISEAMRAQIRGLDQASRNAQDGQALLNTAEGGMQEIHNMLQRIRELTVQAANDTNTEENRAEHIALEIDQLLQEITAMANRVQYNGMTLLNGDFARGADRYQFTIDVRALATAAGPGSLLPTGSDNLSNSQAAILNRFLSSVEFSNIVNAISGTGGPATGAVAINFNADSNFPGDALLHALGDDLRRLIGIAGTPGFDNVTDLQAFLVSIADAAAAVVVPKAVTSADVAIALAVNTPGATAGVPGAGGAGGMAVLTPVAKAALVDWLNGIGGIDPAPRGVEFRGTGTTTGIGITVALHATGAPLAALQEAGVVSTSGSIGVWADAEALVNWINGYYAGNSGVVTAAAGTQAAFALRTIMFGTQPVDGIEAEMSKGVDRLAFQIGANSGQLMHTSIADMRMVDDSGKVVLNSLGHAMEPFVRNWEEALQSNVAEYISDLIDVIHYGIEFVSRARAELGAVSNRLDFTGRSLDISSENLSDAESRVRNADMAREMMRFTMANVLQQASVSMLAQANQMPNNLLQLLR